MNVKRIKCIISYDGTFFSGYQVQPEKRTVQGELEKVLEKIHKGQFTKVISSGRTDAGVHAIGQVIHFDSSLAMDSFAWKRALNALIPDDIVIKHVEYVDDSFHSRFGTSSKEYRYKVSLSKEIDVFKRHFVYHYPYAFNVDEVKKAANYCIGTHDFSSFCASNTDVKDKVRTINYIDILQEGDEMTFCFNGNGFLYNMVRILVGTLLEVGNGKRNAVQMKEIIKGENRALAGKTAPAHGLYLWQVNYNN
jgi:tRNA pseudouridine38-40 synthase